MSWNHRVLRRVYKAKDTDGDIETFEVCEAYTGEPGLGWTGPIAPFGETLADLKWELESMLKAVERTLAGEDPITETISGAHR